MQKSKKLLALQLIGMVVFCVMAAASSSSSGGSSSSSSYFKSSNVDWRGAAVGGVAGYNGYTYIGRYSSKSEAAQAATNKGYGDCIWDANNGATYAK